MIKKSEETPTFEFLMKEIDKVLNQMENGSIDKLEDLLGNFEYGSQLIEKCQKMLNEAELRVQKINKKIKNEGNDESS